jgi:outer membrane protein OmpA-like peptidoglycan-associated protein
MAPAKLTKFITFEPGRRRVYWKSREELRLLAATVRAVCPAAIVTVEGNAYVAIDEERSIELGQARADIVRELLVKHGLSPERVHAVGLARSTLAEGNGRHVNLVIDCPRSR